MELEKKKTKKNSIDMKRIHELFDAFYSLGEKEKCKDTSFKKMVALYKQLKIKEREIFFRLVVEKIEVTKVEIEPLLKALAKIKNDDKDWPRLITEFRHRADSPRLKILRKISRLLGGLKFLLDFRGDLLSVQAFTQEDLNPLDSDLVFLFELLFKGGFLRLEEITLDSPYRQLEIIKKSDLVHPMTSIEEMGQRLGKDRRCFALYHRLIKYEPIIFIEVALTKGVVTDIREIIDAGPKQNRRQNADTVIFYSINNTQNGLTGIGLGKMIIGQVVDYIKKENKEIKYFATLSPVPGFWANYLSPILQGKDDPFVLKSSHVKAFFSKKQVQSVLRNVGTDSEEAEDFNKALFSILSDIHWIHNKELSSNLNGPLVKMAYHYIAEEKKSRNRPIDPVANFHLANGASVSKKNVNYLGNLSPKGLRESCGVMVNYIYSQSWLSQIRKPFSWFKNLN